MTSEITSDNARWLIESGFPGGNVIVERLEGDYIHIRPDLRDTEGHWFYWSFRVIGKAGRTLRVRFTRPNCLTAGGACISTDGGETWHWHGREMDEEGFDYTFSTDGPVHMALAPPYTQANLDAWLHENGHHPHLRRDVLCTSEAGRPVERLWLGRDDARHRVTVIARQHACESLASFELEGLLNGVLADDEAGQWLRDHVQFMVVPFMDKDGVEAGDQGKNRRPHDHNRDWVEGRYASVGSLRRDLANWAEGGRLRVVLDLHCPWVKGRRNEDIYLVGSELAHVEAEQLAFSEHLARVNTRPLPYDPANFLPYGVDWNTGGPEPTSFGRWAPKVLGVPMVTTIEFPYAFAGGEWVTPDRARSFGKSLAKAICAYLDGDLR